MTRASRTARLAGLYGMVERMRLVELRSASGAVAEVERTCAAVDRACEGEVLAGRVALMAGDLVDWRVAERGQQLAEVRGTRLELLLEERERKYAAALDVHRSSQVDAEQMRQLTQRIENRRMHAEERRLQAESDDRFASRLGWNRANLARKAM